MQEFLESNITAFIKKAIAENDSGLEELIRNYGIEGVKNSCSAFMALRMRFET